jgi:hypothetical protein
MSAGFGTLTVMANEPQHTASGTTSEVLDPAGLTARAAEVAARQRSPETRRTYAAVYRALVMFLRSTASPPDLTPETLPRPARACRSHARGAPDASTTSGLRKRVESRSKT